LTINSKSYINPLISYGREYIGVLKSLILVVVSLFILERSF
jgi:hypothetical protein